MIRTADRDLEFDVLALQALPGPSGLDAEHVALGGGATCALVSVICCQNTVCVGTCQKTN